MTSGTTSEHEGRNEVLLVGRVAAPAQERELPSGDRLATFRVVVDRPPPARPAVRVVPVDTVDCCAWTPGTRRTARALRAGDVVEVQGALRRRFWRSGTGTASRTEVEVTAVRRLARPSGAARPSAGRRAATPVGQES